MSVPGVLCINDLKGLLASFGLFFFLCVEVVASEMPSPEFIKGMSYELDGRATMHAITANMAKRFDEGEMNTYWSSYHRLEEFSRPRYENIARVLGIELPGRTWVSIKARVISWSPGFMMPWVIENLRNRTVEYVERLRWLSGIGPAEEREFYAYMVRQELMQIQLMDLALKKEYAAAEDLVARFIAQESVAREHSF